MKLAQALVLVFVLGLFAMSRCGHEYVTRPDPVRPDTIYVTAPCPCDCDDRHH